MIWFWIVCAVMVAAALASLLTPLLRGAQPRPSIDRAEIFRTQLRELEAERDAGTLLAEQYTEAVAELKRRALEEVVPVVTPNQSRGVGAALVIAILLPASAAALYAFLGNAPAMQQQLSEATAQDAAEAMLRKLAADAASKPNDANAWIQLAVAYKQMDRLDDALRTFDHASRLAPDNAALLAEYAEAVATSAPSGNAQRTLALVQRALAIDGEQQKALFFGGLAAVEAGQPELGVGYWERLLKLVPPQSEVAGALANGLSKMQEAAAARRGAGAINRSASVSGEVRVAPSLATKVAADDAVFVIARSSDGSRRPLAVLRLTANKLPAEFRLDDGLSMFPDAKLSGVKQVVIAARVSKSGDAVAQPGDLEGSSAPVAVGSKNVRIIIDRVVPER